MKQSTNDNRAMQLLASSAEEEAERLRKEAEVIREQARQLEEALGDNRRSSSYQRDDDITTAVVEKEEGEGCSLKNKKVLVVGANGRLGSMVCRYLLRNNPETEVVAAVHYVGEASTRGYGRLSYEVGAEDGRGQIGAAWSEERDATFMYTDEMASYNLRNLRVIDVELLDPVQCMTITEDCDSVIWCATDFNGNKPRAVSGLDIAFLFRAVAAPTKGRVEIEGIQNILGGLKNGKRNKRWRNENNDQQNRGPVSFVLISSAPDALDDFVTPFGDFIALKRDGERILREQFPSISYTILQMAKYDENFVDEGLDVKFEEAIESRSSINDDQITGRKMNERNRRINRRDAARAACNALTDENLFEKTVQVYTVER